MWIPQVIPTLLIFHPFYLSVRRSVLVRPWSFPKISLFCAFLPRNEKPPTWRTGLPIPPHVHPSKHTALHDHLLDPLSFQRHTSRNVIVKGWQRHICCVTDGDNFSSDRNSDFFPRRTRTLRELPKKLQSQCDTTTLPRLSVQTHFPYVPSVSLCRRRPSQTPSGCYLVIPSNIAPNQLRSVEVKGEPPWHAPQKLTSSDVSEGTILKQVSLTGNLTRS